MLTNEVSFRVKSKGSSLMEENCRQKQFTIQSVVIIFNYICEHQQL
jgi:hypothetical protein